MTAFYVRRLASLATSPCAARCGCQQRLQNIHLICNSDTCGGHGRHHSLCRQAPLGAQLLRPVLDPNCFQGKLHSAGPSALAKARLALYAPSRPDSLFPPDSQREPLLPRVSWLVAMQGLMDHRFRVFAWHNNEGCQARSCLATRRQQRACSSLSFLQLKGRHRLVNYRPCNLQASTL